MNEVQVRILLVEDMPSEAKIVQHLVQAGARSAISLKWARSLDDAKLELGKGKYDVILTDLGLPDSQGLETVDQLRLLTRDLPIIAMTAQDEDDLGLEAIRRGANDYIPKAHATASVIARAIDYSIARNKLNQQIVEANEQLERQNERLAQLYQLSQQFVDNVSHEFRTPLTVIREFASIVRDGIDGPVTEMQEQRLSSLVNRTDDLANMVDDLLDTSRLEAGLLRTCRQKHQLADIIQQTQRMLKTRAQSKRIAIELNDVSADTAVYCDEEKLRRVLINLLVNAIKFTPADGRIEISVSPAGPDSIRVTVADSGPGISPEDLERIFERFQQVESHQRMASCRGFGLGLSIARSLAFLNLGSLGVASEEGNGCRFSVVVPLANPSSVLRCYLAQRTECQPDQRQANVFSVGPDELSSEHSPASLDTVDEFLCSSVKSSELVLRVQPTRWLVFTCDAESRREFGHRFAEEWESLKRNHYSGTLPDIVRSHVLTADIQDDRQTLLDLVSIDVSEPDGEAADIPRRRVLVVDDEFEVAEAIESRLRSEGFEVDVAHNGLTGLLSAAESHHEAILLDMSMPGMDGLTVLRKLRANETTASIPVIALSASLRNRNAALDSGASFFVQKPFQSNALVTAIDAATVQHQSQ